MSSIKMLVAWRSSERRKVFKTINSSLVIEKDGDYAIYSEDDRYVYAYKNIIFGDYSSINYQLFDCVANCQAPYYDTSLKTKYNIANERIRRGKIILGLN